jgi:hypothetical protein
MMKQSRWIPRSAVALAAAALGTAGLGLAVVPSFAQEPKAPPSEQPANPPAGSDLREDGATPATGPAINGPQEAGNRIENVSANLTLESARIESLNLNDTDQEYAVYHFGRVVHEIRNPQAFTLKGFNVATLASAAGARLVQGDPTSVLVGYAPGTDLSRYTLASVDIGAVEDEAGEANLPGSVPLEGSTVAASQNLTDGPDLVSVRAINSLDRVVYTYDEQIDERAGGDAARFGYSTADGKAVSANMALASADEGAVKADDASRVASTLGSRPIGSSSANGMSAGPYLTSVSMDDAVGQVRFVFDKPLDDNAIYQPDNFMIMTPAGDLVRAASMVEVTGNPGHSTFCHSGQMLPSVQPLRS